MDITGGQSSHAVSVFQVTGTIGTREPAYPSLPTGWKALGNHLPASCPLRRPAPSFLDEPEMAALLRVEAIEIG